jgi:hypothetical protein
MKGRRLIWIDSIKIKRTIFQRQTEVKRKLLEIGIIKNKMNSQVATDRKYQKNSVPNNQNLNQSLSHLGLS